MNRLIDLTAVTMSLRAFFQRMMALRRTVAFIQKWQPLYLRDGQRDHAGFHDDSPRPRLRTN